MRVAESSFTLIHACQQGDLAAFHQLFEHYRDRVYSIALRYSGDPAAASDIAQDVFLKLFSAIRQFQHRSCFDTWLYRLVTNCCIDHSRRRPKWAVLEHLSERVFARFHDPARSIARGQIRRHVQQAVAALPPKLRIAIVLRYTEDLSYDQLAEILECPPGTVASRLNRAHRELAASLARHGWREEDLNLYD